MKTLRAPTGFLTLLTTLLPLQSLAAALRTDTGSEYQARRAALLNPKQEIQ